CVSYSNYWCFDVW
nr:immunoglobulin heavy chain junction region [Mus musculus]